MSGAIATRSASGALTNLTLQVMYASLSEPYIRGNVLTSDQIEDCVEMSKEFRREFVHT